MKQEETIRWDEHCNETLPYNGMNIVKGKISEPAKHLCQFPEHKFNSKILRKNPNKTKKN